MRNFWEVKDIVCGMFICCESWPEDSDDISGLCSVTYKIGYRGGSSICMCLVSITDGLIMSYKSTQEDRLKGDAKQVLVDDLNSDRCGFRILTADQILRRIKHLHKVK